MAYCLVRGVIMKKLRVLFTDICNRDCEGCCNKDWDLDALEEAVDYNPFDEIYITGGEPMLYAHKLLNLIDEIQMQVGLSRTIYVHTAKVDNLQAAFDVLSRVNGMTVTLHEQSDVEHLLNFDAFLRNRLKDTKSLRLNIFKGVKIDTSKLNLNWKIKDNIEWIKDCPLPKDEVFMRTL